MNLKDQLDLKLKLLQNKLNQINEAFKYNTKLVNNSLNILSYTDPIRNIFAKYNFILEEILNDINSLVRDLDIYLNHKEIILIKEDRIKKALELLDEFEDKITNLLATLQAIAIYLENLLKI